MLKNVAIKALCFISLGLRMLRFPIFLSTLNLRSFNIKFYSTHLPFVQRFSLLPAGSVDAHYRDYQEGVNALFKFYSIIFNLVQLPYKQRAAMEIMYKKHTQKLFC
ncbi:hypothetical protein CSC79_17750 [Pseudoalteromonas sp. 3D05]|nr:hypothetical protein CSC79_17750 [Pseudoalteromonas sp. 3D05]